PLPPSPPAPVAPPPLAPAPLPAAPSAAAPPAAPGRGAPAAQGGEGRRWLAYSLLAVGAGGLLLAVIEGSIAAGKADKLEMQSRQGAVFDPAVEANGKRADAIAITSGVIGAAALAVGGILLVTRRPAATTEAPRASLAPLLSPVIGQGLVGAGASW